MMTCGDFKNRRQVAGTYAQIPSTGTYRSYRAFNMMLRLQVIDIKH